MSTASEWRKLQARYKSVSQYSKRKVLSSKKDLEDFTNWLIDQGAEVLLNPCQHEALRFHLNNELGIVWTKGSGNLLAHDLGIQYSSKQEHTKPKNDAVEFQYCFSCKEVQELSGDQCSVCHSYIKF